jgi:hypothetical protein
VFWWYVVGISAERTDIMEGGSQGFPQCPYSVPRTCLNKLHDRFYIIHNAVYDLKCNPTTITYCGTKIRSEVGPPPCNRLSQPPRDTRVKVTLFLGRCSLQFRKKCADANMVYSREERVFILEHYFAIETVCCCSLKTSVQCAKSRRRIVGPLRF